MILHLITKGPGALQLTSIKPFIAANDKVLFIEDGVYHCSLQALQLSGAECYCLEEDLAARGMLNRSTAGVTIVSYDGFVSLCVQTDKVKRWS